MLRSDQLAGRSMIYEVVTQRYTNDILQVYTQGLANNSTQHLPHVALQPKIDPRSVAIDHSDLIYRLSSK